MTAPPVQAPAPRSRLVLAAIALACCLTVYVIVAPLLLRDGTVGWRLALAITVPGVAAIATVAMLWRLHRKTTALAQEIAARREREQQLLAERDELPGEIARRLDAQARAVSDAVRYTLTERIPAAIEGVTPPPAATGIDAELAKLLEMAMEAASSGADQQASMRSAVVALSRRVQASAHRIQEEATLMADRHPGDAGVLDVSMRVDHAAAQQARTAQSIAVLLGERPGQQWQDPLPLVDVVRAAAGRIIAYRRIEVAGDPDIAAVPAVVEPLIHLVAELLGNATQSSPPSTQVPVAVLAVQRGAVIEVHDCGVGLDDYRLAQIRAIAAGKERVGLEKLGEFPQTGLAVVGQYVRRHGFRVDLSESVYGGVRAIVGIPFELVEIVEPAESASVPAAPVPAARAPEASATATDTPQRGLPRRHSPRHSAVSATSTTSAAGTGPSAVTGITEGARTMAQPSPAEAGAWMGAFLNTATPDGEPAPDDNSAGLEDNSTEQQEQG
jgi:signal transduction histidine kinase